MTALTNSRQEIFTQAWFSGETRERAAILAGYSPKWARAGGSKLAANSNIMARYQELQRQTEDATVATVKERKKRLTEILRADIPDYITETGIRVDKTSPNIGAVSEITTRATMHQGEPVVITNLKLHNPIAAIDTLNKMDGAYQPQRVEISQGEDSAAVTGARERFLLRINEIAARIEAATPKQIE